MANYSLFKSRVRELCQVSSVIRKLSNSKFSNYSLFKSRVRELCQVRLSKCKPNVNAKPWRWRYFFY